ncbi:MAG: hypothetical protein QXS42_04955, partial [Zestosphaera sp.]
MPLELYDVLVSLGASILIVLMGYAAGRSFRWALRNALERLGTDEWFRKFAIGKAILRGGYSPSEFFSLVASWIIYVASVLTATYYVSSSLELTEIRDIAYALLTTYLVGFVKAFSIIITGFILVDSFISYLYKSSELRAEQELLTPVAEYLRILLYVVTVVFALE